MSTMNIYSCKVQSERKNKMDLFYAVFPTGKRYYLFKTRHCFTVFEYYKNGVRYEKAIDFTLAKRNFRLCKIMERVHKAGRYISNNSFIDDTEYISYTQNICCA